MKLPQNLRVSRADILLLEEVHENLRRPFKREPEDKMEDLNLNTMIWGTFMWVNQQSAVYLGTTKKLVSEQTEIHGISVISWQDKSWRWTTLLSDRAVPMSTASLRTLRLCMGRIPNTPVSASKEKIEWFVNSAQYGDLDRIDGEPMEFEWKNFPRFTTLHSPRSRKMMAEIQCEFEQFPGRIIFMSMYNDTEWENKETKKCVLRIPKLEYAKRFAHRHWSFLWLG